MSHIDIEIQQLKNETIEMWQLVQSQLLKGEEAFLNSDKDLAQEVIFYEKRVNAFELTIDRDCENIFALFNPVAIDLRFVLAVLKINTNLERIGDIADGIARFILELEGSMDASLLESTELKKIYNTANEMLDDVLYAFENEDTKVARKVFKKDDIIDTINTKAASVIMVYIKENPDKILHSLHVLSIIRKLERAGDQIKNIAEEIIFYIEAKVLKHKSKKIRSNE